MTSGVLHLLSDSTGETASAAATAVLSQFEGLGIETRLHVFVRARRDVDAALEAVRVRPGVVVYTLLDPDLVARLREGCRRLQVEAVPLLQPLIEAITRHFGQAAEAARPGRQHDVDGAYFARVAAIDYAMALDDGATAERLGRADVILLGVSRTSKTPTCLYLAVRGVKAANVPLIPGRALPAGLEEALAAGVPAVGLTASPGRLVQIRGQRLEIIGGAPADDYADPVAVREEVAQARLVFDRLGVPVIDVTRRSIEETAATIMSHVRAARERTG